MLWFQPVLPRVAASKHGTCFRREQNVSFFSNVLLTTTKTDLALMETLAQGTNPDFFKTDVVNVVTNTDS